MAVLELHRGGRDPENVARVEGEAARIMRELVDSLPLTDCLREPADLLARALELRVGAAGRAPGRWRPGGGVE